MSVISKNLRLKFSTVNMKQV